MRLTRPRSGRQVDQESIVWPPVALCADSRRYVRMYTDAAAVAEAEAAEEASEDCGEEASEDGGEEADDQNS